MPRPRFRLVVCALAAILVGPAFAGGPPPLPAGVETVTTASGLEYADLAVGLGPAPEKGQTVVVHYTGWLNDGLQFDSTRDRGKPFGFKLGEGRVIKGWEEGVASMKLGGRRRLIVPPALAYGAKGIPGLIPPNARLTFDVELLRILH